MSLSGGGRWIGLGSALAFSAGSRGSTNALVSCATCYKLRGAVVQCHTVELLEARDQVGQLLGRADADLEVCSILRWRHPTNHAERPEAGVGSGGGEVVTRARFR